MLVGVGQGQPEGGAAAVVAVCPGPTPRPVGINPQPESFATTMRVFTANLATETNAIAPMPNGLVAWREAGCFAAGKHPDRLRAGDQFAGFSSRRYNMINQLNHRTSHERSCRV